MQVHADIRLDGPNGPETAPTARATAELLAKAVAHAAARFPVTVAGSSGREPAIRRGPTDRWATDRPRSRVRGGRAGAVHGICWIWSGREVSDGAERPECPVGALGRTHRRRPLASCDCRMRPRARISRLKRSLRRSACRAQQNCRRNWAHAPKSELAASVTVSSSGTRVPESAVRS